MKNFTFIKTGIQDLYLIETKIFKDTRGYFMETFNEEAFQEMGVKIEFVQDNESSSTKGVLRGLHFQKKYPQGKLVRVAHGEVFDVAIDLRIGSPTFGKAQGFILSEENKKQLYIPEGFAHGFLVLSEKAIFNYKCTNFYAPGNEGGILWNDPTLAIEWPIKEGQQILLSDKDKQLPMIKEIESPFIYEEEIKGEDIVLKPITEKDIELIRLWRNIQNCQDSFLDKKLISKEAQLSWYERYAEDVHDRMFMIMANKIPVGVVAVYHIDYEKGEAEFGRLIVGDLRARGKRIGIKATRAVCEYGFNKLGLRRITLEVFKDNIHAKTIYEKIGFKVTGERPHEERILTLMELTRRENK